MAKEQIYPYAVARIRVLEKNLLTKQTMYQMADDRAVSGCLRTLADAGYEGALEVDPHDFEKVLSTELEKTYAIIRELVPEEKFIEVFLYKNDYHNLKVLIKQEVSGLNGEKYLVNGGTIPLAELRKALLERSYGSLPLIMRDAIAEAFDSFSKTQSGQMIDIVLDKAVFKQMEETADASKNEFVMKYVSKICDLTNLKSFLRIRNMKKPFLAFSTAFLEGGDISLPTFSKAFALDNPSGNFKATAYGEVCEAGMHRGFTVFEKLCDDYIMDYIKSAKYMALSLEPLIAYLYAKESEIKTVRIILTSKLNGIDSRVIKERVREAYV